MSPNKGNDVAALARQWDAVLGDGSATSFTDATHLFQQYWLVPFDGWATATIFIKHWTVTCHVLLGSMQCPRIVYNLY